jgi:predicted membrane channel-forming protein YqfA (hemolysin III family)
MTERTFHIAGWVLFIFSAFGFITSSAASGDAVGLTGAVLFLIAYFWCFFAHSRARHWASAI